MYKHIPIIQFIVKIPYRIVNQQLQIMFSFYLNFIVQLFLNSLLNSGLDKNWAKMDSLSTVWQVVNEKKCSRKLPFFYGYIT